MAWSEAARQAAAEARANAGKAQAQAQPAAHQAGVQTAAPSAAARELQLYADNHSGLYRQSYTPIMENLTKKSDKGIYDADKATKLWGYHADRAAQSYAKEHGDGRPWHQMFTPSDRRQAASEMERSNRDSVKAGDFRKSK